MDSGTVWKSFQQTISTNNFGKKSFRKCFVFLFGTITNKRQNNGKWYFPVAFFSFQCYVGGFSFDCCWIEIRVKPSGWCVFVCLCVCLGGVFELHFAFICPFKINHSFGQISLFVVSFHQWNPLIQWNLRCKLNEALTWNRTKNYLKK